MKQPSNKLPKVNLYFNHEPIIELTRIQILKDFEGIGETLNLNQCKSHKELFNQLFPLIAYFIQTHHQKLMNVLYRIDVSEQVIQKKLNEQPNLQADIILAHLIIEREMRKVITRLYFSENPKNKAILRISNAF